MAPPLDDRPSPETVRPLPLLLTLESDQSIIRPGERRQLTLNAWRATHEPVAGLLLTLALPAEIQPIPGNQPLQWRMPELANDEIFSQTIDIELLGGAFPFSSAVLQATLYSEETAQFSTNRAAIMLGVESRAPEPPASDVASAVLQEKGLVLHSRYDDITLLVEAASAELETEFRITSGYRWGTAATATSTEAPIAPTSAATTTSPISPTITLSQSTNVLYLPYVRTTEHIASATPATSNPRAPSAIALDEELRVDNDIAFVRQWRFDATYQGTPRSRFDKWVHIQVDAGWLLEQGFDPHRLTMSM